MTKRTILYVFILALLQSCTPNVSKPSITEELLFTPAPLESQTDKMRGPTTEAAITPTRLPVQTPTSRLSTDMPEPLYPAWSPVPTELEKEVQGKITNLLETNNGCMLPCWWGFVPGKTNWQEAKNILLSLGAVVHLGGVLGNAPVSLQSDQIQYYGVTIPSPRDVSYASDLLQDYTVNENGTIVEIETYNYDFAPGLYFPKFIEVYGKPTEVWVRTFSNDYRGIQPFEIILFYPNEGILIELPANEGNSSEQIVQGCFKDANTPFLYLWQPKPARSFDDVSNRFLNTKNWEPLPLNQATGINVDEFYQMVIGPNSSMCIETPSDLWPKQ